MNPSSEPTPADVAAVGQFLGTPEPAPAPQPVAPTPEPTPAPAPAADPFEALFAPAEPTPAPAPQPAEPLPTPQPSDTPVEPVQPAPAPAPQPSATPVEDAGDDYQSYEDYMNSILAGVPEAPAQPDPSQVNPEDPEAIKGFFDDLMNTAVARAKAEISRTEAIQSAEKQAWEDAMDTYGSLRTNKELRDMVHNIRMANFQRGVAMTPTQAAQKLLGALQGQYRQGIADNQVVTTIESVQPTGGGSGAPVATSLDKENIYAAVQDGGETALAAILDGEIKAGRL